MPTAPSRAVVALIAAFATLLAACGQGEPADDGAQTRTATAAAEPPAEAYSYDELHLAAEHMETFALALTVGIDEHADLSGDPHARAAELLATLDFLLREHTVLTAYATDARIARSHGRFLAASEALTANSDALRRQFVSLFDEETAQEFEELWSTQVEGFLRYAQAVRNEEEQGKQEVREELEMFAQDFAAFIVGITGGLPEEKEIEEVTTAHVETTLETIEAQLQPDWFDELRTAVDHMKEVAEKLAEPIATDLRLDGDVTSVAAKLRADLSGRMMEDPAFVGAATLFALLGETDQFDHARALVDENTEELRELVAHHLGEETAGEFADLWTRHNDLFVDLARALDDEGGTERQEVLDELATVCEELGGLMEEATGGALSASAVQAECATHVDTVQAMIEATAHVVSVE